MVAIYLRNHDSQSEMKAVKFTISSHRETCDVLYHDTPSKRVPLEAFFTSDEKAFQHPLLQTEIADKIDGVYCIQYADLDELAFVGRKFYATLIRKGKQATKIRIQYTGPDYTRTKIPFSIDPNHMAQEKLSLAQFESFVRVQYKLPSFHWFQGILIDEVIALPSLPKQIDADSLFEGQRFSAEYLTQTIAVECRYISDKIGLGVFASETLPADKLLMLYSGRLVLPSRKPNSAYYFKTQYNGFKRNIDSLTAGCYSRFVNHAPRKSESGYLSANLAVSYQSYFGFSLVTYKTLREIKKGEQLLIDYGPRYWEKTKEALFPVAKKVTLVTHEGEAIQHAEAISKETFYNMAQNGISKAQIRVFRRPLIALALSLLVVFCLNYYT